MVNPASYFYGNNMKTATFSKLICGLALLGLTVAAPAQNLFTYSGGNDTALSLSLNSDLQFTLQNDVMAQYGIGFSITNAFSSPQTPGGYQINILSGMTLSDSMGDLSTGIANVGVPDAPPAPDNTANLNDNTFYLFFQFPTGPEELPAGDVITLTAGSAVTMDNFPSPTPVIAPDDNVVVHDGMADELTIISPAPEPSMLALSALSGVGGLLCFRRRK